MNNNNRVVGSLLSLALTDGAISQSQHSEPVERGRNAAAATTATDYTTRAASGAACRGAWRSRLNWPRRRRTRATHGRTDRRGPGQAAWRDRPARAVKGRGQRAPVQTPARGWTWTLAQAGATQFGQQELIYRRTPRLSLAPGRGSLCLPQFAPQSLAALPAKQKFSRQKVAAPWEPRKTKLSKN